jgi:photosystem II stability/assembly factor-like uncharacterized protein
MSRSKLRGTAVACGLLAIPLALAAADPTSVPFDPPRDQDWELPHPDLYAIDARGAHVWAVGAWGTVQRSSDRGTTWSRGTTPTSEPLYAVSFADESAGFAAGGRGTILRTRDGGATWEAQRAQILDEFGAEVPLDTTLFGVAALSAERAWAVGDYGVVLRTRDGKTWEQVHFDASVYADSNVLDRIFNVVRFPTAERGLIAGEFGTILLTRDGGETWSGARELVDTPEDLYLFDLSATPDGSAAAVGLAGSVLLSDGNPAPELDGSAGADPGGSDPPAGAPARWIPAPVATSAGLFGVAWRGDRGVVVGDRGVLFVTDGPGKGWREPRRPRLFNWLTAVAFATDQLAYVVGEQGLILRSEDGGESWVHIAGREPPTREGVATPHPGRSTEPGVDGMEEPPQAEPADAAAGAGP